MWHFINKLEKIIKFILILCKAKLYFSPGINTSLSLTQKKKKKTTTTTTGERKKKDLCARCAPNELERIKYFIPKKKNLYIYIYIFK